MTHRDHYVRCRGIALTEFVLVLPLAFVLFIGILDFGRVFYTAMTVSRAARLCLRQGRQGLHDALPLSGGPAHDPPRSNSDHASAVDGEGYRGATPRERADWPVAGGAADRPGPLSGRDVRDRRRGPTHL